jgi:hypothetical protein
MKPTSTFLLVLCFGRGAASEAVQSSSPVESMAFHHAVVGSSPASPISIAPQNNEDDVNNQVQ